jgi:DNA (cytosine-5)-methyltransferase 1
MGKPSGTRCIHPFQHCGLTAREGARLQGFPDCFHFTSGITSQRLQVANAVSPILAEVIGTALADDKSWLTAKKRQRILKLAFSDAS